MMTGYLMGRVLVAAGLGGNGADAATPAEMVSLRTRVELLERQVRVLEEEMDTFVKTPWWKRALFALDGWPLYRIATHPQRRPWHWLKRD